MSSSGFAALDRRAIADIRASGRHLLVQGAMGLHSSDGLGGKVASAPSGRPVCVGTISGVGKTPEMLRAELRRAAADAGGGYVGVNLMAAIDRHDLTDLARVAIGERASFIVQGAGISARSSAGVARPAPRSRGSSRRAASRPCTSAGAPSSWWRRAPARGDTSGASICPWCRSSRRCARTPPCRWWRRAGSTPERRRSCSRPGSPACSSRHASSPAATETCTPGSRKWTSGRASRTWW